MKITVHWWPKKQRWVVAYPEDGKRHYQFFTSESHAHAEATRLRGEQGGDGQAFFSLPPREQDRLVEAHAEAQRRGVNLYQLVLRADAGVSVGPTLEACISELVNAKQRAGRAAEYTNNLSLLLSKFAAGRETMRVSDVTLSHVERWLDAHSLASRSTLRARLSTLFKFCLRRGYCQSNPCAGLEPITYRKPPPQILTVEQAESCFKFLREKKPRALAWFVLSCFCGLRPEEAEQTLRRDIHHDEGWIKVEAQTSKVRQRRVVYPRAEAMAVLKKSLKGSDLPLRWQPRRRALRALRVHLGWKKWPKDLTRHTAASYWLAVSRSAADISESLGNSESVLLRDYKALVTVRDGERFWKMVARL